LELVEVLNNVDGHGACGFLSVLWLVLSIPSTI
jgi:hypothetical protein